MVINGMDSENVKESLRKMQYTLEKNGKPCCLNLITEPDSVFMETLAKARRIKENTAELIKLEAQLTELANSTKD